MIGKKWTVSVIIGFICLIFLMTGVLVAKDLPTKAPDEISINTKGYQKDKYGPVPFHHKKHATEYVNPQGQKIACIDCHHVYKDGKNTWKEGDPVQGCAASGCHDPEKAGATKNQLKLQAAYHKNCKDCHKDAVTAGKAKDAPFKKCSDCMHGK